MLVLHHLGRDPPPHHGHPFPRVLDEFRRPDGTVPLPLHLVEGKGVTGGEKAERLHLLPQHRLRIVGRSLRERRLLFEEKRRVLLLEMEQLPEKGRPPFHPFQRIEASRLHEPLGIGALHAASAQEIGEGGIAAALPSLTEEPLSPFPGKPVDLHEADAQRLFLPLVVVLALVDVRRQDGETQAAPFRDVGERGVVSPLVGDHRRHELGRVVRLHVGGLGAQKCVACRVRLAERVAGKGEDLLPDRSEYGGGYAPLHSACDESRPEVGEPLLLVLFRDHLAQLVTFAGGKTGELHGDLGDLLLVDGDSQRLPEDPLQQRVQVLPLFPLHARHVLLDEAVRRGSYDGRRLHEHLEYVGLEGLRRRRGTPYLAQQKAHRGGFEVEAADGEAAPHEAPGALVLERTPARVVNLDSSLFLHRRHRVADHGERAVPEDVDFDEPRILGLVLLPLDDRQPLVRDLHRDVPAYLVRDDDEPAAVQRKMAQLPVQPPCRRHDLQPVRR